MKRKIRMLLALLLCALLLSGCGVMPLSGVTNSSLFAGEPQDEDEMPHFSDMVYERPQAALDDFSLCLELLERELNGGSFRTVKRLLERCYTDYYHFDTMYCLAEIRSCLDMTDAYYAGELSWCLDGYYELQEMIEDMLYLCGGSPMADRLEREYFWEGFAGEYADASLSTYTEEVLALLHQENALLTEYRELTASPTIVLNGREEDLYSYLETAEGEDYYDAWMAYYEQYNEKLGRLYIDLVKTRRELAAAQGFDSYEQMAYSYNFDRDYTPEEAARYVAYIREYIVPIYEELDHYYVDYPYLEEDELCRILEHGTDAMGGDVRESFRFMRRYELYDVSLSVNKQDKSFQTYLEDYDAPFVLINPMGDDSDILTFAHEFGHFVDAYVNYNADESVDVAEVFSQAMEYLMLSYAEGALPEERLENLRRFKWLDTLELYVQQASFAAFEEAVYAADPEELTPEFLNELSLQTAIDFGYYDGYSEEFYALSWIDIVHFFEQPFYVISYPVSNDLALQIWELEQQEPGCGLAKYLEMLPREYDGMIATAEAAGLQSPFAPGRIETVAGELRRNLKLDEAGNGVDNYSLAG